MYAVFTSKFFLEIPPKKCDCWDLASKLSNLIDQETITVTNESAVSTLVDSGQFSQEKNGNLNQVWRKLAISKPQDLIGPSLMICVGHYHTLRPLKDEELCGSLTKPSLKRLRCAATSSCRTCQASMGDTLQGNESISYPGRSWKHHRLKSVRGICEKPRSTVPWPWSTTFIQVTGTPWNI